ncbi:hypothetical protein AB1K91_05090 [Terribacillus sp. 179-K 1B1 HS]|uniref:hypothetical protein n=1 Tax=Terribacillus sp. 179-K 1B1 HS TaxID=3142388 RepID=UPI00399F3F5E
MQWNVFISDEDYRIAESNGIKPSTLRARIRDYHWDKQDAITRPVKDYKYTPWARWKDVCRQNGISRQRFRQRISEQGWSEEKAATTPIQDTMASLVAARAKKQIITDEVLQIMLQNGLCKETVHSRLRYGWSLEKAITTPVNMVGKAARKMKKSV